MEIVLARQEGRCLRYAPEPLGSMSATDGGGHTIYVNGPHIPVTRGVRLRWARSREY